MAFCPLTPSTEKDQQKLRTESQSSKADTDIAKVRRIKASRTNQRLSDTDILGQGQTRPCAESIAFDGAVDFQLGNIRHITIGGDIVASDFKAYPTGLVPPVGKEIATARKKTLFKNPKHFRIETAEFVDVNGSIYGSFSSKPLPGGIKVRGCVCWL